MSIVVSPLKGFKSLRALNGFHALLLGLKMLPMNIERSYEEFYESFTTMTEKEKERYVRQAVAFCQLAPDEIEAMVSFVKDRNGIPYSSQNISNLSAEELTDIIVAVCMEIGRIKVNLLTGEEKKSSHVSA